MGNSASSSSDDIANVSTPEIVDDSTKSKVLMGDTPIQAREEQGKEGSEELYPTPTGREYEAIDKLASELPHVIDEESRQQVEDYFEACNDGKGPMVACFASGEYMSLFDRKHKEAAVLYRNTCFRPKTDKSPNGKLVDGTKAYPAGCFNLGKMLMTGKGVQYDRYEAYQLFDRACRGGHGGACHLQAQILCSPQGALDKRIPHSTEKAMGLYQHVCDEYNDSLSCFALASMLLRGVNVSSDAGNVTPQEAQGITPVLKRENEYDRIRKPNERSKIVQRDPKRAEQILLKTCVDNNHATSCHNLAVMYTQGDDGIPQNLEKAKIFQQKTAEMVKTFGGLT